MQLLFAEFEPQAAAQEKEPARPRSKGEGNKEGVTTSQAVAELEAAASEKVQHPSRTGTEKVACLFVQAQVEECTFTEHVHRAMPCPLETKALGRNSEFFGVRSLVMLALGCSRPARGEQS